MHVTHSMMRLEDDVACSNAITCQSNFHSVQQSMLSSFSICQGGPTYLNGTNIKHHREGAKKKKHDDTFCDACLC